MRNVLVVFNCNAGRRQAVLYKKAMHENVGFIGKNAFKNTSKDFTIVCKKGSYAEQYAKDNRIKVKYLDNIAEIRTAVRERKNPSIQENRSLELSQKDFIEIKEGNEFIVEGIDYSIMDESADKVKLLRPKMQEKVYEMFRYAKRKRWKLIIKVGYRSHERQLYLYNKWKAGEYKCPLVAEPGTSKHEFGCAVDITLLNEKDSSYKKMGKFGKSIGLTWGGDWDEKIRERWHFELNPDKIPRGYIKK